VIPTVCLQVNDGWPDPRMINAGCSNALNLADMVEDPQDLLLGRELGPGSAAAAAAAIERHQQGGYSTGPAQSVQPPVERYFDVPSQGRQPGPANPPLQDASL
jgi:hypothetical protein